MRQIPHETLWQVTHKLKDDYEPWGSIVRWAHDDSNDPDCSTGCRHAAWLTGDDGPRLVRLHEPEEPPGGAADV